VIKPTRIAVAIFTAGIPLSLLLAIEVPQFSILGFTFSAIFLVVFAADVLMATKARGLPVRSILPERLYIGDRSQITGTVVGAGLSRPLRLQLLAEQEGYMDPAAPVEVTVQPGSGAGFALPLVPRRRGRIEIVRLWLRWRGPFALAEVTRRVPVGRTIDVLANVKGVQSAALQFYANEAVLGLKVQREKGIGTEFEALCEFLPGMDSRFIDWKHSARHRKLLSREFGVERNHQIVMGFDTGYLMREPVEGLAKLDHAINAGLLLAWISLNGGDLVGVYGFDAAIRHYLKPIRTLSAFPRIQEAVAQLDYRAEETNFTLALAELNVRLRRRALVILFTDFVDTVTAELLIEGLQRIANRHVVLFVSLRDSILTDMTDRPPEGFEDVADAVIAYDLLRDRRIVLERLERLGIHCLDIAPKTLPAGLINRYLSIKQRGLI